MNMRWLDRIFACLRGPGSNQRRRRLSQFRFEDRRHFNRLNFRMELLEDRRLLVASLAINDGSVIETGVGQTSMLFTVTRSGDDALSDLTFNYSTSDLSPSAGSATAGSDYTATNGSTTIPGGSNSTTISVPIHGDTTYEGDEQFFVNLTKITNVTGPATSFVAKTDFSAGASPLSVAIGDLNGDGKRDLAIANVASNSVSILLNTTIPGATTPTYAPKTDFSVGLSPFNLALADLNGDGKLDLAVVNAISNTVSVLMNTTVPGATTPTYAVKTDFVTGASPRSVAIGDLNGDGKLDLVVANTNSNTISVLMNATATGANTPTFAAKTDFATGLSPRVIGISDLNGDGKPDLAIVNIFSNAVSVLLNLTPTGTTTPIYSAKTDFTTGTSPYSVAIGDLNGDGKPDLAVANRDSMTVSVLQNTTVTGVTIPTFATKSDFTVGTDPITVAIEDLNGDGKPDLAVAHNSSTVSVLRNMTSTGDAPAFAAKSDFATGSGGAFVATGDLNGDGKPDLAIANLASANVSVLLNSTVLSSPSIDAGPRSDFPTGANPRTAAIADLNGDGKPDVVTANLDSNTVSVLLNTTPPGAAMPSYAPKTDFATDVGPISIAIGDLNGDGNLDLVTANLSSSTLSILLNTTAPGAAIPSYASKTDFATGAGPFSIAIGDLNGDGKPDLAIANFASNTVSVLHNTTAPGASTPTFAAKSDFASGASPRSVVIGDLNGDGKPDVATANLSSSTVSVLMNTTVPGAATPSYAAKADFATGAGPFSIAIRDLNGDGKPDVATANLSSSTVSVLLNTTVPGVAPTFAAQSEFATGAGPFSIATGDLNGDGKPDLAIANLDSSNVSVLLNATAPGAAMPSFAAKSDFATGSGPQSVSIGDLNGDGKPDLAVANRYSANVSVLLNQAATISRNQGIGTILNDDPTLSASLDGTGNLNISDVSGGNNSLTAKLYNDGVNDFFEISDAVEQFSSLPVTVPASTLTNGNRTLRIPLSAITGSITINTFGGNDSLTLELAGGDFIPAGGFVYAGGSGIDSLTITGGNQGTVTYNYTNANDGSIVMSNFGSVTYTGLDPITNSGTASDVVFNLPASGNVQAILEDDGISGNSLSTFRSSPIAFETTTFANPTGSLTINRGSATDTVMLSALPDFTSSLTIGASGSPFASASVSGAVTLAATKTLSVLAGSIVSAGSITTSGGTITLNATGDITVSKPILSSGGVQSLQADSDGDGVGTLTLALALSQFVDPNPAAGNQFGATVLPLTSGNVVVTSPFDDFGGTNAGAVYLFNGLTGALLSTLRGSTANDNVGSGGITVLSNGNYVVRSNLWDNGAATDAGAVTWGSGTTGVSGVVSAANSLVGSTANDNVGIYGVTPLSNGNYVVLSYFWDNGAATDAGAATWGSGTTGVSGVVSAANSAIGSTAGAGYSLYIQEYANSDRLFAQFPSDNGGRVVVGSRALGFGALAGSLSAGSGSISLRAAHANIQAAVTSTSTVSIASLQSDRAIDLGTKTGGSLSLTDVELDLITAGTVQIGDANSGSITVSADINRASATNIKLLTAGDITINGGQINTGGGTLLLDSGASPAAIKPTKSGTDVTASILSFGSDLAIVINGVTVDTQYTQLDVVGIVNLTGVDLKISGSYTPAATDSFIIVDNDGSDAVMGIFNALSEGTILSVNGTNKRITYVGGTGNDVALLELTPPTVVSTTPSFAVSGSLAAGTTSIQVTFSEPVLNGALATNYELRRAGTDGLLLDSDTLINPTSVSISGTTATLSFAALVEDVYRLTVNDAITDLAGNVLDGDANSTAGGNWVRDFVVGALTHTLTSPAPNSYPFDVEFGGFGAGQLVQGTGNAFDGLNRLQVNAQSYDSYTISPSLEVTKVILPSTVPQNGAPILTTSVTVDGINPVRLRARLFGTGAPSGSDGFGARFVIDGVVQNPFFWNDELDGVYVTVEMDEYFQLSAGAHTIAVQLGGQPGTLFADFSFLEVIETAPIPNIGPSLEVSKTILASTVTQTGAPILTTSVTVDGINPVRLRASLFGTGAPSGSDGFGARFVIDGVVQNPFFWNDELDGVYVTVEMDEYFQLSAGMHTIAVQLGGATGDAFSGL